MYEQLTEIAAFLLASLGVILTFATGILIWTFKNQIKRLDNVEEESREIKDNYIERFDEIKTLINKHNDAVHAELSSFKVDIALIKQKISIIN
jgi:regulatory protein YycH of two-component signal transduction system YycFG